MLNLLSTSSNLLLFVWILIIAWDEYDIVNKDISSLVEVKFFLIDYLYTDFIAVDYWEKFITMLHHELKNKEKRWCGDLFWLVRLFVW